LYSVVHPTAILLPPLSIYEKYLKKATTCL
jgi:hypothetical protein